jgi:hypothetical protein
VDAIPAWLRLAGVIPKHFGSLIDDARAEVNFFVSLWMLSILFAALAVGRSGLTVWTSWLNGAPLTDTAWAPALAAVVAVGVASLAYRGAIDRAIAWGGMVKAAFDLYLPDLAKQMGYGLPLTQAERRAFWDDINRLFLYREPLPPDRWPPLPATTRPCDDGGAEESSAKTQNPSPDDHSGRTGPPGSSVSSSVA